MAKKKPGKGGKAPVPVPKVKSKPAEAEEPTHPLCLRCPDPNQFDKCDPVKHKWQHCIEKYSEDEYKEQLWWGFSKDPWSGELPDTLQECKKLLQNLQRSNDSAALGASDWEAVIDSTKSARRFAKFQGLPITVDLLRHALDTVFQAEQQEVNAKAAADARERAINEEEARTQAEAKAAQQAKIEEQRQAEEQARAQEEFEVRDAVRKRFQATRFAHQGQGVHPANATAQRASTPQQSHRQQAIVGHEPTPVPEDESEDSTPPRTILIGQVANFQQPGGVPDTGFPLRVNLATPNDSHTVLTNHFKVRIPAGKALFEYRVENIPAKATRAKKRMMILDMIEHEPFLWSKRDHIATDYQAKIISDEPLFNDVQEITVNNYMPGTREAPQPHKLQLHFIACHELDDLRDYALGRNINYTERGASDALNIILSKVVTDGTNDTFQAGSNRFYFRRGWKDLKDSGLIGTRGYFSSVKPVMDGLLLNVNTVTSPFYKGQDLADYLQLRNFKNDKNAAERHLAGLRVHVNFNRQPEPGDTSGTINSVSRRTKTLAAIGDRPQVQRFPVDTKMPTVWDHLSNKYPNNSSNTAKQLFTGNVGKKDSANGQGSKYYLATQLTVLSGQPFRGDLSTDAIRTMIDIARRSPARNYNLIMNEGMASLRLKGPASQSLLGRLQLTVDQDMCSVPARKINAPSILYSHGKTFPTSGFWDLKRSKVKIQFMSTLNGFSSQPDTKVRVQFFYPQGQEAYPQYFDGYVANFQVQWKEYGLPSLAPATAEKFIAIRSWSENVLKQTIAKAKCDLAVVIFPGQSQTLRDNYATFRIMADQLEGVSSICLNEEKMIKSNRNHFKAGTPIQDDTLADYMRNIMMKLNLRSGNTNHTVKSVDVDLIRGQNNRCNTMILGADVTHPGAGSVPHAPSLAAVVGSVDNNFGQCPGSMRLNPARQEYIADMKDMARERLMQWYEQNETLPENILFYRDGVGDSYLVEIRDQEVTAIAAAWEALRQHKCPQLKPNSLKITAIVVTKRHHTRLYPTDLSGNCKAGTVVDSGITHSYYQDFYLLSHLLTKGTAKPSHYIVIQNDMGLNAQQLQDITYHLCYTYGRSTNAVSYAPAAYYADRLCERGRLYLKHFYEKGSTIKAMIKEKDWSKREAEEAVMNEARKAFYRNGKTGGNPWHENLEGKMFWM